MSLTRMNLDRVKDNDVERVVEMRSVESDVEKRLERYRHELRAAYAEIDRFKAAAVDAMTDCIDATHKATRITRTRETIDGVECERIKGLDVIVPVGLIPDGEEPAEVRSYLLPFPLRWLNDGGEEMLPINSSTYGCDGDLAVLLADKPAPAPTPTWTPPASAPDGIYIADNSRCAIDGAWRTHELRAGWYRDYVKPANGVWRVESGRAVYLGSGQEATT